MQLPTVDVLVAKSDIGLGQSVGPDDVQWQTWPAATASNNFIRRTERPDATAQIAGSIARSPFIAASAIGLRVAAEAAAAAHTMASAADPTN